MARVIGPLFSNEARGLLASTFLYRRGGRAFSVYPYRKPRWPNTMLQQSHHSLFSLLAARWNDFSAADQDYWAPFARCRCITNYNAFLSYNLRRLNPYVLDGLIGWWPSICPNGNTLYDLTDNANHGSWNGPLDHWAPSRWNLVQKYVAPNAAVAVDDLPLYEFGGDFSVAYHYHSTSSDTACTVSKWTGLGSGSQWWVHCLATEIKAGIYTKDPSVAVFDANLPAASSRWHHVALVREGSTGHLYVDAVDRHTRPCSPSVAGQNSSPLTLGNWNGCVGTWPYTGLLHDVRLYDRAISPTDVDLLSRA